jgi:hypothetical protein
MITTLLADLGRVPGGEGKPLTHEEFEAMLVSWAKRNRTTPALLVAQVTTDDRGDVQYLLVHSEGLRGPLVDAPVEPEVIPAG